MADTEAFVQQMQPGVKNRYNSGDIPRSWRLPLARPLAGYAADYLRDGAMARACMSGRHSLAEIARHFGVQTRPGVGR